jgi:hypothetical protein
MRMSKMRMNERFDTMPNGRVPPKEEGFSSLVKKTYIVLYFTHFNST